ncbi:MAG: hypothetical protein ACUVYA_05055 [Planctomycetota bacterium]
MRKMLARGALLFVLAAVSARETGSAGGIRFRALDVFVDAGAEALAAYQVEISAESDGHEAMSGTEPKIVGVEGGEPEAYASPPYYDPAALQGGRIVLAAFTTADAPPRGRMRVARIHMAEPEGTEVRCSTRLVVAAAPGGSRIEAAVELAPTGGAR